MHRVVLVVLLLVLCAGAPWAQSPPGVRIVTLDDEIIEGPLLNETLTVKMVGGPIEEIPPASIFALELDSTRDVRVLLERTVVGVLARDVRLEVETPEGRRRLVLADLREIQFFPKGLPTAGGTAQQPTSTGERRLIGTFPAEYEIDRSKLLVARGGLGYVVPVKDGQDRSCVLTNGVPGEPWSSVRFLAPLPDGKAAYVAEGRDAAKLKVRHWVIAGDWKSPDYHRVEWMQVLADGKVAYLVQEEELNRSSLYVAGEKVSKSYDFVVSPIRTPTGQVAFIGNKGNVQSVVIGNKVHGSYQGDVKDLHVALDGTVSFVLGLVQKDRSYENQVCVGDKKYKMLAGGTGTNLTAGRLQFGPDGIGFAYELREFHPGKQGAGDTVSLVFNGKKGPTFRSIKDVRLGPEGRQVVYIASDGKKTLLVVGTKASPLEGVVAEITFSPNGKSVAYALNDPSNRDSEILVLDGKPILTCRSIKRLVWAPDSRNLACVQRLDTGRLVVSYRDWLGPGLETIDFIGFPPDGRVVVYSGGSSVSSSVYVGDQVGPMYQRTLAHEFSEDGTSVGYAGLTRDQIWWQTHPLP